jgi:hypothetical protein
MANGTIVPSRAVWKGDVEIAGVRAQGVFEVFDSGGGWKFLFGKPMLHGFKAIHNYETDQVDISGIGGTRTLHNQSLATKPSVDEVAEEVHTLETEEPSSRQRETENAKAGYLAGHGAARRIGGRRWKGEEPETKRTVRTDDASADPIIPTGAEIPICILTEDGAMSEESVGVLLKEIPVGFLGDDNAIFTRLTDPFNAN